MIAVPLSLVIFVSINALILNQYKVDVKNCEFSYYFISHFPRLLTGVSPLVEFFDQVTKILAFILLCIKVQKVQNFSWELSLMRKCGLPAIYF